MATIKVKCIANCYSIGSVFLSKGQEIELEATLVKEGIAKKYLEVIPSTNKKEPSIFTETEKVETEEKKQTVRKKK